MEGTSFELTEADLIAANRTHCSAYFRRPRTLWLLLGITGIYFALGMVMSQRWSWSGVIAELLTALLLGVVMMAVIIGISVVLLPYRSRRVFRQQKSLRGTLEAHWDSEAIEFTLPTAKSRQPWGDFLKWGESRSEILLYHTDGMFNLIPKRALSEAQTISIRGALDTYRVRKIAG